MPKNKVSDPITDQEMAFAHLVLSGTMTDRRAAEAVGLNPESAGYVKSKPRVRAYMAEHRLAVREKLVQQESEGLRKLNLGRDKIVERLWELASLSPAATRDNISGQLKALAMIAALVGFVPEASAPLLQKEPAPLLSGQSSVQAEIYSAAWLRKQRELEATTISDEDTENPAAASPDIDASGAPIGQDPSLSWATGSHGKQSLLESESESVSGPFPKSPPQPSPSPALAPHKPGLANRFAGVEKLRWAPKAYT